MTREISCRGVIIHDNKLLVSDQGNIHCLPGGKIDPGEDSQECVIRELKEELGVEAKNPQLIAIQELIKGDNIRIDFMYLIENAEDFLNFDLENASHGYEVNSMYWLDLASTTTTATHNVLPKKIVDIARNKEFGTVHHWIERI